jgi:hypothetical protein
MCSWGVGCAENEKAIIDHLAYVQRYGAPGHQRRNNISIKNNDCNWSKYLKHMKIFI